MHKLHEHISTRSTPQSEPIPGSDQVPNDAGGHTWAATPWTQAWRFLILGTEGGSFYAGERQLTQEAAANLIACLKEDGPRLVRTIAVVSRDGRAPSNDPALFALALASALGDEGTRVQAFHALPVVARTGTHLFNWLTYRQAFGGWGRGMRRAVTEWYTARDPDALALQLVKYRQRNGWTHRDALRKAHPRPHRAAEAQPDAERSGDVRGLLAWAVGKGEATHPLLAAFEEAQSADTDRLCDLIREHRLPREVVPTPRLAEPAVWHAMLDAGMPMTALVRNLATMTRLDVLVPMGGGRTAEVCAQLTNPEALTRARVHPIALLAALSTYSLGASARGTHTWAPVRAVVEALEAAFHLSFGNVEPSGRRTLLALDVSASMDWPQNCVSGVPGLTSRAAAAAMAMVTARTEPQWEVLAFSHQLLHLPLTKTAGLRSVMQMTNQLPHGATDCALPMLWASKNDVPVDMFVIYTDNQTWYGNVHPVQALRAYREKTGIAAKVAVVSMTGNGFTIADPQDAGMLDVVGFDTATPAALAMFAR